MIVEWSILAKLALECNREMLNMMLQSNLVIDASLLSHGTRLLTATRFPLLCAFDASLPSPIVDLLKLFWAVLVLLQSLSTSNALPPALRTVTGHLASSGILMLVGLFLRMPRRSAPWLKRGFLVILLFLRHLPHPSSPMTLPLLLFFRMLLLLLRPLVLLLVRLHFPPSPCPPLTLWATMCGFFALPHVALDLTLAE